MSKIYKMCSCPDELFSESRTRHAAWKGYLGDAAEGLLEPVRQFHGCGTAFKSRAKTK